MANPDSTLEALRRYTTIVADTSDFEALEKFNPQDATTNPTIILTGAKDPRFSSILDEAVKFGLAEGQDINQQAGLATVRLLVAFGTKILERVPGRVSTEIDVSQSYNTEATVKSARAVIRLYETCGVSRERILIKIASTWEGLQACRILELEGIHCNMTLLFSVHQAQLAAEAGATVISPFVARTSDWWRKTYPDRDFSGPKDPGVVMVSEIYRFYKTYGIETKIMPASLRTIEQCQLLAGCDLMTINVKLLQELQDTTLPVQESLHPGQAPAYLKPSQYLSNEKQYKEDFAKDLAATEKFEESLKIFMQDSEEMKSALVARLWKDKESLDDI